MYSKLRDFLIDFVTPVSVHGTEVLQSIEASPGVSINTLFVVVVAGATTGFEKCIG